MLIYDVILDVGTTGCQQSVSLYQGDNRSKMLRITLLQDGRTYAVPSDMDVRLHGVMPDDTAISPSCGVRGGSVYYLPAADVTATQGTVLCQLQLRDHADAILFTPEFAMEVVASLPIPELPQGAVEDMEYNAEVLSALSASADGSTLLFRGEPVGSGDESGSGITVVRGQLPGNIENGSVIYRDGNIGSGLYIYWDDTWIQLTDNMYTSMAPYLADVSHTHQNKSTLDTVTAEKVAGWDAASSASHTHANKTVLDKLTVSGNALWYDGKPVGVEVLPTGLPSSENYEGRVVYVSRYDIAGLYVFDGLSWVQLTDNFVQSRVNTLWEQKHTHTNKTVLDKLTQANNGKLLYDGNVIGGITTVSNPSALPVNAAEGTVAIALADESAAVAYPAQVADESVTVDIDVLEICLGSPEYSAAAFASAITAQDIGAKATIVHINKKGDRKVIFAAEILPVVADTSDNPYTNAGITIDPDEIIVAQNAAKNYAVCVDLTEDFTSRVSDDKKIRIDATHISVPVYAVYMHENLTGVFKEIPCTLSEGWNIAVVTIEDDGEGNMVDITDVSVESVNDINEWVVFPEVDDEADDEYVMSVSGTGASEMLDQIVTGKQDLPKGMYLKLGGIWNRIAME